MQFRPPQLTMSSQQPPSDYKWNITDEWQVKNILANLRCPGVTGTNPQDWPTGTNPQGWP
jgi:hypothetical protein